MINKKKVLLILAAEAVLPAANFVDRQLHVRRVRKSRERIRSLWNSEGEASAYELDRKAFRQYLDDLGSFYETPSKARQKYEDNLKFNDIIRNL